ncbi:helix-turn-helix domain-containing protein [Rhodococcus rhodochrous]|uniref:Helix-turn-helix domain-containing protein n=1 Tax=Rhodococcus rhodochrous TaxID=1829 RepID=A0AAW4XPZ0_RHORH|nr:helix-turn-helix domain-containing protein [Rhodococcus rhodochrous]MCD2114512.1 helix-turn-helix domain-containing protein [Rhodococcus rhodochrous]
MYRELPTGIRGVTLWRSEPSGARVGGTHVLPDGCMDLIRHADGFLVAGPDTTSQFSDLAADRPLTAVRFEPGLGARFFGVDASELTDRRVPLDEHDPMADLARTLAAGAAVTEVAATLGWSDRTLRRRSARAYGYGPKMLSRVLRFRRAVARARAGDDFARVAADCGYSDQAHLAREVRALSGVTLGELARGRPGSAANRSTLWPSGSIALA